MHQGPGNRVAIRHVVVHNARAAHAFSAGIRCRHCSCPVTIWPYYGKKVTLNETAALRIKITRLKARHLTDKLRLNFIQLSFILTREIVIWNFENFGM